MRTRRPALVPTAVLVPCAAPGCSRPAATTDKAQEPSAGPTAAQAAVDPVSPEKRDTAFRKPPVLGAFVHRLMPEGNPDLSVPQALDVAAFVISRPRPELKTRHWPGGRE